MGQIRRSLALAALVGALALSGCSGPSSSDAATSTTAPRSTTTAAPRVWAARVSGESDVDGNFRQGIARSGEQWIFTNNLALYRTSGTFVKEDAVEGAIPKVLADQGYDHLGDPDVADGKIWIPVERDDKSKAVQVTARYDEKSLTYMDSFVVAQHHNAFVSVDAHGVVYSADQFTDDSLVRYTVSGGKVHQLKPLKMSQTVDRIQGGDVADGAIWLSTDDDHNGVYRVDLVTGEVTDLGSMGHIDGEGEGIDATALPSGLLHPLVADAAIVPMWVVDLKVSSRAAG